MFQVLLDDGSVECREFKLYGFTESQLRGLKASVVSRLNDKLPGINSHPTQLHSIALYCYLF
jgi:hypothetical protein